jgi:hypothetical protein
MAPTHAGPAIDPIADGAVASQIQIQINSTLLTLMAMAGR